MDTKWPPESQPNKGVVFATPSRIILMRGVTAYEKPAGRKRFFLRWRGEDGGRKAKAFTTEKAREKFARALMAARERIGRQALSFDAEEWAQWLRFKDVVGAVDPLTVAREWLAWRRGETGGAMPCADAADMYLRAGETDEEPARTRRKRLYLGRWLAFAGSLRLAAVEPGRVREWLDLLHGREGFEPVTVKGHRKILSAFFRWCIRERLCAHNPCEAAPGPRVVNEEVTVMPVADGVRLFAANAEQPVAARMALEAFGGVRFSHAGRLAREELDFERRGIVLAAAKHKSRRRGYLEGLPDNLWAWLAAAPAETWEMSPCQYMHAKSAAFRRAGVVNAGNVLRHSFGSYFLAWTNDAMKTAEKMQHTTPKTLYHFYKGAVNAADAERWFAICP